MTNKLTVEEIAKQIREEVATGKYGFVKAVSRALEKHASQEVEEATKPLVGVIKRVEDLLDIAIVDKSVSLRKHTSVEAQRQLREALNAHYEKYPKHCPDSHNKEGSMNSETVPMHDKMVDDSHKYTDVLTDGYVGPGGAHHHYLIKKKGDYQTSGVDFVFINFQDGPIKEAGVNGVMDENLIAIVIDRLRGFQKGPYLCRENAIALTKLEESLMWLKERTAGRERRGVEGTHKV